jgi:hypothetical protein
VSRWWRTQKQSIVYSPTSRTRPSADGTSSSGTGALPSPKHDDIEGARAVVDRHDIGALPQPQRRKQTRNTENVIEMAVRQQEPVEPSESSAAPEQLALGALPAVVMTR